LLVDLAQGTYVVSCRIVVQTPDGELVDHYELGMVSSISVVGETPASGTSQPTPPAVTRPEPTTSPQDPPEDAGPGLPGGYGTAGNE
ncbi:MAG: hypothetical protein R3246_17335, partial [Acidimicrobiia bacterium]|nr:hypothetical protein [Acidimicrobiia bacterium]